MQLSLSILGIPVTMLIIVVTYPMSGGSTTEYLVQRGETMILYIYIVLPKRGVGKCLVPAL